MKDARQKSKVKPEASPSHFTPVRLQKIKKRELEYHHDLVFIEGQKLATLKKSAFVKDWSAPALRQLDEALNDFKLELEAPFQTIKVSFDSGRVCHILPLPKDLSVFESQVTLRAAFAGVVKTDGGKLFLFDTSLLPKVKERIVLEGLVSLAVLESWKHPKFSGIKSESSEPAKKTGKPNQFDYLGTLSTSEISQLCLQQSSLASSTNLVRTLADTPANFLKPDAYSSLVKSRAKDLGYKFEFLSIADLKKLKAGSFLAVAKGDPDDLGGIVKLSYSPKKTAKKSLALVGKGICFDTGGYNIKTGNYMHGMHRDMTGSAIALAVFEHLVRTEAPYQVTAYLALAENLISPHANRPNDLVFAANGMSIEIVDTDAEGRLILADTLYLASKVKPDLMIDYATLTGAVTRSLDSLRAGVFSNDAKLLQKAVAAGDVSGERTWGFPIGGDYGHRLKSEVADIKQCSTHPNADHIYAATFLSRFVEKGTQWVHMDLACDTNPGGLGLVKTETTGFGIRWTQALLEDLY